VTLITGREDAVLVDALLTTAQATALAGWIEASGRNLTTVYVTHGHGDHCSGDFAFQRSSMPPWLRADK
jgi:glyoxylase-like metal-dependent hydrolase (beta-lactamase superfamily II)